jgi:hypothetical protein
LERCEIIVSAAIFCRKNVAVHWLGFPAEEIESDFLYFQNNLGRLLVLLGK